MSMSDLCKTLRCETQNTVVAVRVPFKNSLINLTAAINRSGRISIILSVKFSTASKQVSSIGEQAEGRRADLKLKVNKLQN